MVAKLGNFAIAMVILFFTVSTFSAFINNADSSIGVDSGIIGETFTNATDELSAVEGFAADFNNKIDNSSSFAIKDASQDREDRGTDVAGIMSLVNKNILVNLMASMEEKVPGFQVVAAFIILITSIIVGLLFLRFFWGESKI